MTAENPVPARHADLNVACDSCGQTMPAVAGGFTTLRRLRCAACQVAVIEAMELVVRQFGGPHRLDAIDLPEAPTGAAMCFDCETAAED